MTAHTPWFAYPVLDQTAVHQLTTLCAELQSDVRTLQCQVMELEQALSDSRAMLDAVFTIETEPDAEVCPECHGTGVWKDNLGIGHFCWACKDKVQS